MVRKPKPKEAARILKQRLSEMGVALNHQSALELVASIEGYKSWNVMTAEADKVEASRTNRGTLKALSEAAKDVINASSNEGCSDDLTVTSAEAVERLERAVQAYESGEPLNAASIQWSIRDVQSVRPDLIESEALLVLQQVINEHDASIGINWEVIASTADYMFMPRLLYGAFTTNEQEESMLHLRLSDGSIGHVIKSTGQFKPYYANGTFNAPGLDSPLVIESGKVEYYEPESLCYIVEELQENGRLPDTGNAVSLNTAATGDEAESPLEFYDVRKVRPDLTEERRHVFGEALKRVNGNLSELTLEIVKEAADAMYAPKMLRGTFYPENAKRQTAYLRLSDASVCIRDKGSKEYKVVDVEGRFASIYEDAEEALSVKNGKLVMENSHSLVNLIDWLESEDLLPRAKYLLK